MDQRAMPFIMHAPEGDVTMQVLVTFFSEETKAHYMLFAPPMTWMGASRPGSPPPGTTPTT